MAVGAADKMDREARLRVLLDDLAGLAEIDVNRVYATGMSNGGMMAYRLASELSDRFAAIASVSGPMTIDTCRPNRPVSILHFHGTADEFAPYYGGRGPKSLTETEFRSVELSVQSWIEANGCPRDPTEEDISDSEDVLRIEKRRWGPGEEGSEVVLYTIRGGGHTWPGRVPLAAYLGAAATAISANDILWDFFQRHSR